MEKERGMHFVADIRRTKRNLQKGICKLINQFEKAYDTKVIKVCYESEQEEDKPQNIEICPIEPEEIHIKLEDI